jgi:hypothetical protein
LGLIDKSDWARMRVGFLFNHDQIHQIAHSLPIARALAELAAKTGSEVEIVIATTQANLATEVRRQLGPDRPPAQVAAFKAVFNPSWTDPASGKTSRVP